MNVLPEGSQERKDYPMAAGLLDYFPAALAEVAKVSKLGNDKHNPGEPLHHARGKSMDHADCIVRHLVDRGGFDEQGVRHSAYLAWRALANLQQELEDAGAPLARGARLPEPEGSTCPEPGGCDSCPDPPHCRHLRVENRITTDAAERAAERPEYTVKPVPRDQYDPESTDGGW